MAPTATRSSSQPKIFNSFRASGKGTKSLKSAKAAVQPTTTKPAPTSPEAEKENHLNPKNSKYVSAARAIEADRKAPFGSILVSKEFTIVHPESQSTVNTIMRNFDLSPRYGPCVGITRLDRYRRAEKMGLKPPIEVLQILETEEGLRDWNTDLFSQKSTA
jgi:DNA polymerase delta subunit 4